jgi:hypothetical protein
MRYLDLRAAYVDLQRQYRELDARYRSLLHAARATTVAWTDLLDQEDDGDPQLAIVPDACGVAAS